MSKVILHDTRFLMSAPNLKACPDFKGLPEFAFVGRSNVGKSSLINSLLNRKDLAKTSNTPGKTRLINLYQIELTYANEKQPIIFADLPGYGYAKVSKKEQESWGRNLEEYLKKRDALTTICLLIDSRLPSQDADELMLTWLVQAELPFFVVLTKTEKLGRQEIQKRKNQLLKDLADFVDNPEDVIIIPHSAKTHAGRDAIWDVLLED